ncbi:MAG: hypothetical protein QMD11_10190 [Smithella sp.]|nr:hypothetical protein [Smithella sp.]
MKISGQIKENEKLTYQIKEQKELAPVYANLISALKEKDPFALPHPEKTPLARSETGKFQEDLRLVAKKSGLAVGAFTPDINSAASPSASFLHHVVLRGDFAGLRKMLIGLGSLAYLDRIEEIGIQQTAGSMEFNMKIWIALK